MGLRRCNTLGYPAISCPRRRVSKLIESAVHSFHRFVADVGLLFCVCGVRGVGGEAAWLGRGGSKRRRDVVGGSGRRHCWGGETGSSPRRPGWAGGRVRRAASAERNAVPPRGPSPHITGDMGGVQSRASKAGRGRDTAMATQSRGSEHRPKGSDTRVCGACVSLSHLIAQRAQDFKNDQFSFTVS